MKPSSLQYLLREGFRSIWQNRFMAVASSAVLVSCLLVIGAAYLIFRNIDAAFQWVYQQNVVVASVREECTGGALAKLGDDLADLPNVSGVEFLSKDETLERLRNSMSQAVYDSLKGDQNPILDSYIITFDDLERFDQTVAAIRRLSGIESVNYNAGLAKTLTSVRQVVWMVGVWVVGILLVVSLFIIVNTIKLTLYSRRLEIYIMKSVGATNWFVRLPFIIEGSVIGLASGLLAYGVVGLVYPKLKSPFDMGPALLHFDHVRLPLMLAFLACGLTVGLAGSIITLGRYLRKKGGMSDE